MDLDNQWPLNWSTYLLLNIVGEVASSQTASHPPSPHNQPFCLSASQPLAPELSVWWWGHDCSFSLLMGMFMNIWRPFQLGMRGNKETAAFVGGIYPAATQYAPLLKSPFKQLCESSSVEKCQYHPKAHQPHPLQWCNSHHPSLLSFCLSSHPPI